MPGRVVTVMLMNADDNDQDKNQLILWQRQTMKHWKRHHGGFKVNPSGRRNQ